MTADTTSLRRRLDDILWPVVESLVDRCDSAGLAVAVVCGPDTGWRVFGTRDLRTRAPVTAETMFHLASVSKPFVATAIASLAVRRHSAPPVLELDAPVVAWVPEFTLADGREAEVTLRGLLTHTSGLPDVSEYGWHQPRLDHDALSDFARSLSGWQLQTTPGTAFSYSNAGFELLGLALSRAVGSTFEDAMRELVLVPLGMRDSTFARPEVRTALAAAPHVGMPLVVPGDAYPYTRAHAPSSSLHANLVDLCRWMRGHLDVAAGVADPTPDASPLDPAVLDELWRPAIAIGEPPWEDEAALGWCLGHHGGHRVMSHSGADPGFASKLALVPERRTGVVVLSNSNTLPTSAIAAAALDAALGHPEDRDPASAAGASGDGLATLRALRRALAGPVAEVVAARGHDAAVAVCQQLAAADSPAFNVDDEGFEDAVWGAIELHRTDLVWPLLRVWTTARPESATAWTMAGWAHQVDGDTELARSLLRRALDLDPDHADAALILGNIPPR